MADPKKGPVHGVAIAVARTPLRNELDKLAENGVVKMKADWTKNDPVITQELRKFGRNGVPLYVIYGADGKTEILPQVLTSDIVSEHLDVIADNSK